MANRVLPISAVAALVVVLLVGAAVAAKPEDDVTQVTTTLPTLNPGQTAWVSTLWRGGPSDVTSFQLTADGPQGITIGYPENTPGYSSLYKESTLRAEDTDYASFKVQVGDDLRGDQTIKLNVEYRTGSNGNGNGNGQKVKRKLEVTLPVLEATGPTVEQVTTSVGPIKAGSAEWVSVAYKANKPGVTDARLTVSPPAGATVTYPNEGTSTGFAADSTLSVGETDSASFKIHAGSLAPGEYTLELDLSYGDGQHLPGTVTLVVN